MEEAIIKVLAEAGMGLGSLLVLAVVFVYQLKTNSKMMSKMGEKLDHNTEATKEMVAIMRGVKDSEKELASVIRGCQHNSQNA